MVGFARRLAFVILVLSASCAEPPIKEMNLSAEKILQEARAALKTENDPGVTKALGGITAELQAALSQIDAAAAPGPPRRQR